MRVREAEPDEENTGHGLHPLAEALDHAQAEEQARAPSSAETVTWPKPQATVMRTVRPADQPRARARAANGTQ